jgi:hypothetical protein
VCTRTEFVCVSVVLQLTLLPPTTTEIAGDKSAPNETCAKFFTSTGALRVAADLAHAISGYHAGKVEEAGSVHGAAILAGMMKTEVMGQGTSFMECHTLYHRLNKDQVHPNCMLHREVSVWLPLQRLSVDFARIIAS